MKDKTVAKKHKNNHSCKSSNGGCGRAWFCGNGSCLSDNNGMCYCCCAKFLSCANYCLKQHLGEDWRDRVPRDAQQYVWRPEYATKQVTE